MEKIIYVVTRDPAIDADAYGEQLRTQLAPALKQLGARGLRINISDSAVQAASGIRQTHSQPPVESLVQLWVDSSVAELRKPFDDAIAAHAKNFAAYLVTESQPLVNHKHPPQVGERTVGFAQVALFCKPAPLDREVWLDVWQNSHTGIAIRTQSTFEYIQNLVVRVLTPGAMAYDAIVEECFPETAMNNPLAFFDAPGDEAKFKQNLQIMMDSVARFIDMSRIDVAPTSQYPMF